VGSWAWGVQFHVEAGPATVPEWATVPEYRHALGRTGVVAADLQAAMAEQSAHMERVSAALTDGLLRQLGAVPAGVGR
jgi:hypothetical protein